MASSTLWRKWRVAMVLRRSGQKIQARARRCCPMWPGAISRRTPRRKPGRAGRVPSRHRFRTRCRFRLGTNPRRSARIWRSDLGRGLRRRIPLSVARPTPRFHCFSDTRPLRCRTRTETARSSSLDPRNTTDARERTDRPRGRKVHRRMRASAGWRKRKRRSVARQALARGQGPCSDGALRATRPKPSHRGTTPACRTRADRPNSPSLMILSAAGRASFEVLSRDMVNPAYPEYAAKVSLLGRSQSEVISMFAPILARTALLYSHIGVM